MNSTKSPVPLHTGIGHSTVRWLSSNFSWNRYRVDRSAKICKQLVYIIL